MRLVFAGTSEVATPSLNRLVGSAHEVVAVLTRPDAPAGRGRALMPSPVRLRAEQLGIEVLTPVRPSDPQFLARLVELAPEAAPIVAYGGLIPPAALQVPEHGWVNLHFSLLPAWRGAAPVQRAIIAGDEVTGVTTFRLERGLDTGPVFGTMTETVRPQDTAGDLLARLAAGGAELLVATLDGIEAGRLEPRPQPAEGVSLAPKLTVEEGRVDWGRPATAIDRLVRGCTPAPGAWTTYAGARLKLLPLAALPGSEGVIVAGKGPSEVPGGAQDIAGWVAETAPGMPGSSGPGARLQPGEVWVSKRVVVVGTATTPVTLGSVVPHGKRAMPAADWARGIRLLPGARLGGS